MAYLIQKNDGRLTIKRHGNDYAEHKCSSWEITQKPSKNYDFAQTMFFSSCLIKYGYDYYSNEHLQRVYNNDKEDRIREKYGKTFRMTFETHLDLEESAERLSKMLSHRFNELHETVRLGLGVDTSGMNLLDTVKFKDGIVVNNMEFSQCEKWIIKEINPAQDKLVLEELKLEGFPKENTYHPPEGAINPNKIKATMLEVDEIWKIDEIVTAGSEIWYSFQVTQGSRYYIWWSDSTHKNSGKTAFVVVSAFQPDGSVIFYDSFSNRSNPQPFDAAETGHVILRVRGWNSFEIGTFAIVWSTVNTRPLSIDINK